MSSKPIIVGLGIIFVIGLLLTSMLSPFIDVDEQTEDTWVTEYYVDEVITFPIDVLKYISSSVTWLYESITGLFGQDDASTITLSDTGEHDTGTFLGNYSLDGEYVEQENHPYNADEVYENKIRTSLISSEIAQIRVNKTDNTTLDKAWLISDSLGTDYENRVYQPTQPDKISWYAEWELVNDSLGFNDIAYGTDDFSPDDVTLTESVRSFFNTMTDNIKNHVLILGFIPEKIGLPIFILIFGGLLYAIIKALPWT